jgi:hypothetical protein
MKIGRKNMLKNVGIWIDRKHAYVVNVGAGKPHLIRFHAGVDEPFPPTEETRAEHHYTRNDFVAEKTLERRSAMERMDMYEQILKSIGTVDSVWILGPGEAKTEFESHLRNRHHQGLEIEVTPSDKMTEPQLIAKIQSHFSESLKH